MWAVASQMMMIKYTFFAFIVGTAFSYGVLVGKYEAFPYQQLKAIKHIGVLGATQVPRASFDGYRRLVEFPNKTEVPCPQQTGKTGVLLVTGQSNVANSSEKWVSTRFPGENLNYFGGRCYVSESPLLGATNDYGEWITLLGDHLIAEGVYENVVLISSAIGSSSVTRWAEGGDLNRMLISTIQDMGDLYKVTDVIWHQGESDVAAFTHTNTYVNMFESMMDSLSKVGVTGPYYMSIASLCFDPTIAYPNSISNAQKQLIEKHESIVLGVNTDEIVPRVDRYDGCHFGAEAQRAVAAELASSIGRHRLEAGGEGSGQNAVRR
jgi:hypothetical protein